MLRWLLARWSVGVCLAALTLSSAFAGETYTFHHEQVLGTSLEIQIEADSASAASAAEERALREIDRLNKLFSSYDQTSEFSQWQTQAGKSSAISAELYAVLKASEQWRKQSAGAFNPAVEAITKVWEQAEKQQRLPTASELAGAVKLVNEPAWKLVENGSQATPLTACPLSLNAIAKGAIIDYACAAALQNERELRGVMINIGGDLLARGSTVRSVSIADPRNAAENATPLSTIHLRERAIATSGNYRRGFQIAGKSYSHIIDPRNGQPVEHVISSSVVAKTAADADALATIFSVLSIEESLRLAQSLTDVDYMLVAHDGKVARSAGWRELEQPQLFRFVAAVADDKPAEAKQADEKLAAGEAAELLELIVDFELNKPMGGRYRRPYVAIWLEDADEFPVRTSVLWMQTKDPGPRWHRDLLRWYRNDGVRKLADGKDLIGTISGATRAAGEYQAVFDGKDDAGKPLKPGKYTLFIEVAREHGTYQIIRHPLTLGATPIEATKLKPNVEIKSAVVEYRKHQAEPAAPPASK
ncbi:MAG TPA: DUF2271 domain-containing protein [Pirellulaceae bacterium]|nr:DUF2271 domain-containing protein [Pirellulaceae bacterium]